MPTVKTILGLLFVDDQGKQDQPVALLWPSLFTDHRMWRHQIGALQDDGWRTLALDPPGHGQSSGPGRGFTMDECAQAAIEVLDATGIHTPVAYLGTSWGGFVAPRIALRAPKRVSGMVLFNASAERGTWFERTRATVLTKLMAIGALNKVTVRMIVSGLLAPETQRQHPEIGADLAQQLLAWDRRGLITSVRSVLVDRDPVLDALADVNVPALVVSARKTTPCHLIHSQRITQSTYRAPVTSKSQAPHISFRWKSRKRPTRSSSTSSDNYLGLRGLYTAPQTREAASRSGLPGEAHTSGPFGARRPPGRCLRA